MGSLPSNKENILKAIQDLSPDVEKERKEIFSTIYSSTVKKLESLVSRNFLLDYDQTNDLVQSTYEKAYQQIMLGKYIEKKLAFAWVMRIAQNKYINDYKRSVFLNMVSNYDNPDAQYCGVCEQNPLTHCVSKELLREINKEISLLNPKHQYVILGRLDRKKYEDIASEQNIPLGTVKLRIHNAKKQLRKNPHINEMYCKLFKSA